MFEDINQHRAAVAEQIQKACEIGFTGNELEKAHKVGDIHPNGKWVWTQLPSGKYDWRTIKKTGGSGSSAAQAAPKSNSNSKTSSGGFTEEQKEFMNLLKKSPNERYFEQMDDKKLSRFRDIAHQCWLSDSLNRLTRNQCRDWRDLAKQELASRGSKKSGGDSEFEAFADKFEKQYRKDHPGTATSNSDIREQALKEYNKTKSGVKRAMKTRELVDAIEKELKDLISKDGLHNDSPEWRKGAYEIWKKYQKEYPNFTGLKSAKKFDGWFTAGFQDVAQGIKMEAYLKARDDGKTHQEAEKAAKDRYEAALYRF